LNTNSTSTLRQKKKLHKMSEEKAATAKVKIQRLLEAGFIREVKYPTWLANVVMVKKKNGKLQMCTYYINLNECFPKDDLPLSRIGKVVNSAAGCETMTLLDCFSGNHQIWLQKKMKRTSFITPFGTYCYIQMPKGLKNASPTFCRMTKVILKVHISRNVFTYVNDIVVTSKKNALMSET
jgi:hypothetical protein